jgi:hypothetical protein
MTLGHAEAMELVRMMCSWSMNLIGLSIRRTTRTRIDNRSAGWVKPRERASRDRRTMIGPRVPAPQV